MGSLNSYTYLSNKTVSSLGERNNRGGRAATFGVGDYRGLATFHSGHSRVGGTKINTDNLNAQ